MSNDRLERTAALLALNICVEVGICTERQKLLLAQNLLEHIGADGLPDVGRFLKHAFLVFLSPVIPRDDIEKLIKKSYMMFDFESLVEADVKNNRCNQGSRIACFAYSILATSSYVHVRPENEVRLSSREGKELWDVFKRGFEVSMRRARSVPEVEWNMSSGLQERLSSDVYYYDRILSEVIIPCVSEKDRKSITRWLERSRNCGSFLCSRLMLEREHKIVSEELRMDIVTAFTECDDKILEDGFRAVYDWCELYAAGKFLDAPEFILRDLAKVIGMRDGKAFFEACETLGKVVHHVELPKDIEGYVLIQLTRLMHDTEYDYESSRFENEDRADYRAAAANLANQLYEVYVRDGKEVPDAIKGWEAICSSREELDSVRRVWTRKQVDPVP